MHLPAGGEPVDYRVTDLPELVVPGTVMVFNNSKVRKARILARAEDSGGTVEMLFLSERGPETWLVMASRARRQRVGRRYLLPGDVRAELVGVEEELRLVKTDRPLDEGYFNRHGHQPLPPYIRRPDEGIDDTRYQTVYAARPGSVAAPTAGLHFTPEILAALDAAGVQRVEVTLHVGIGTFLPVRSTRVEDHKMHEEWYEVPEATAQAVSEAKTEGRPVLAVGTTSVRTLETAARGGRLPAGSGTSDLFIYPGYEFKLIDRMFTNFHTPESTLVMLVAAFGGWDRVKHAYETAVQRRYRFFSYGDAMLIDAPSE
jgi:S-adenosylmethionine:tRNA ribosyltransferase-isomerase